jgi:two-component system KDP operon response regulator KdpE
MGISVLVVDDDPRVVKQVSGILAGRDFEVRIASDGEAALALFDARPPALVISDLEMPGMNGFQLCRRLRDASDVPIIVMSDDGDCDTEVAALDAGADDYLVKPLVPERLLARMRVALRRGDRAVEESALGVGEFHIDFDARRVYVNGQPVRLTPKEFDLFVYMARHPNRVLRHKVLLGAVWGETSEEQPEYLRVFMGQLRKKLESDPANPRYLTTEPWVGYRFNPTGLVQ